ncbi:hypothetical protein SAMN02745150_01141 [Brevinema andersonii]|uniref:Uncharacterized protein n=1 Tax=Brevinema andersonii TaxID=34097 RepID=A0A1I1EJY6_BREAD|nr:hypothetical protein [Brevinema andersonii]SFB87444.1 hypothetical protein SAMN02745150_01141 [Brevinema andersonii]
MIRFLIDIALLIAFLGIGWIVYKFLQFLFFFRICVQRTIFCISGQLKAVLVFLYEWFQKILSYIKELLNNIGTNIKKLFRLKLEIESILKEDHIILQT